MSPPKVSIGIPTYNGERFIREAIQSIVDQTFRDIEVIVIDDRSTDATVEIVRSLRDPRLVLYENEQQLGIPGNWNRAVSLAHGEYLCLFHQDDRMQPDNLARKIQVLDSDPLIGLVYSAVETLIDPSAPYPPARWMEESAVDFIIDGHTYLRRLLLEGNLICAPSVLVRREELIKVGGFDTELGFACDYALWMKLCFDRRVAFLSEHLVQYRWHADNETHRYRFEKGVLEVAIAGRKVLSEYRRRSGREEEADLLRASVDVLTGVRQWAAQLETAKTWLEEQVRNWQREAEQREGIIADLQAQTAALQTAKTWLEEQVRNWQREAEQREDVIAEQRRTLESLQGHIVALEQERVRAGQVFSDLEAQAWTRIGRRLHLLTHPVSRRKE